mgnify:CR=1 FL=1
MIVKNKKFSAEVLLSSCELCPRKCHVNRNKGEKGFCAAGTKVKIARAALHMWEEPCISGENGSGTVFFSGCNMKCAYCQNYVISTECKGNWITEKELAERFLSLQKQGANNINLVTPTHYVPQIIASLDIAKSKGLNIPVIYNSGGYESVETIKLLRGYIDVYMPDFKYFSDKYAIEYSCAPNYFDVASNAIEEMFQQVGVNFFDSSGIISKGVIVRHMMLPGLLFETKKILDYLHLSYGDDIYISLMSQYTPMPNVREHPKLSKRINESHYQAMVDYCIDCGIKNIFVQETASAVQDFIPNF